MLNPLQAIVLCGPGVSFTTFATEPEKYPKALLPIANKPMVWYVLDLCRRMGITNVTLIVPPSSEGAMCRALETNRHLTALPNAPRLLAPEGLEQTTGTASIFRLEAVRRCIVTDFVVLPCDLVCELDGLKLLRTWLSRQNCSDESTDENAIAHRSGFTMWYDTKGKGFIDDEETDFIVTTSLQPSLSSKLGTTMPGTSKLVYCMPTDTFNDVTADSQGTWPLRRALLLKYNSCTVRSEHRDSHFYIFPHWLLDMIKANEHFDSLAEDVLGGWAKAVWQKGMSVKLGLREIFDKAARPSAPSVDDGAVKSLHVAYTGEDRNDQDYAPATRRKNNGNVEGDADDREAKPLIAVPPIIAYIHPSEEDSPLVRRIDTANLLLSISLLLAKLPTVEEVGATQASPFAPQSRIADGVEIPWGQCTLSKSTSLIDEKVSVKPFCHIKDTVIGAKCRIRKGAKLTRCVLMDGVIVGAGCKLTNCIVGHKAKIGKGSVLTNCEVQQELKLKPGTQEKGERLMSTRGLEEMDEDDGDSREGGSSKDDSNHKERRDSRADVPLDDNDDEVSLSDWENYD